MSWNGKLDPAPEPEQQKVKSDERMQHAEPLTPWRDRERGDNKMRSGHEEVIGHEVVKHDCRWS
ncbi:MAG: hypothetical protein RSP_02980 [Rhodanobacter sp.]